MTLINVFAFMQKMQDLHVQVGFTLRPATPIEPFEALLEQADMVLVMSVNPGFGDSLLWTIN